MVLSRFRPPSSPLLVHPLIPVLSPSQEKWIGQRWDALLSISQITLAPDHKYAQIYLGYHFWTETVEFKSKRVKLSPGQTHVDLQFKQQHTNHHVDQQFIEYLKSRSIQIKVSCPGDAAFVY